MLSRSCKMLILNKRHGQTLLKDGMWGSSDSEPSEWVLCSRATQ